MIHWNTCGYDVLFFFFDNLLDPAIRSCTLKNIKTDTIHHSTPSTKIISDTIIFLPPCIVRTFIYIYTISAVCMLPVACRSYSHNVGKNPLQHGRKHFSFFRTHLHIIYTRTLCTVYALHIWLIKGLRRGPAEWSCACVRASYGGGDGRERINLC